MVRDRRASEGEVRPVIMTTITATAKTIALQSVREAQRQEPGERVLGMSPPLPEESPNLELELQDGEAPPPPPPSDLDAACVR